MSQSDFNPVLALTTFLRHRVEFVLIGGLAGNALGSPWITRDTDICYERSAENLERLAAALNELHARLRGAPPDVPFILDARTLKAGDSFTFVTDAGDVDILGTPSGTLRGYEELAPNAELRVAVEGGLTVWVCSLEDLIRMKAAAGRNKDLRHLEELGGVRDEVEGYPEEPWIPPGERT